MSAVPSYVEQTQRMASQAPSRMPLRLRLALAGIVAYVASGLWVLPAGVPIDNKRAAMPLFLCLYPMVGAVILERLRSGDPYSVVCRRVLPLRRVALLIGLVAGTRIFFDAFMAWKGHLPVWGRFWADPWLASVDARLSGGRDAWQWMAPLLHSFVVLRVFDLLYYAWFPLMAYMVIWRAWRGDLRFFLAFVLSWIVLGTGVALLAHSAGPAFFELVTGSPRYHELLSRLEAAGALRSQLAMQWLWWLHAHGHPSSISAFPSMHVAAATLFAAVCWRDHRWWAYVLAAFTGLMIVATVILGWHYAIDGYGAVVGALGIWALSGWLLRRSRNAAVRSR